MTATLLSGQILTGLASGAGYAIVAIGLTYTLGLARVMNFAFGTFYMLAALCCLSIMNTLGVGYLAAGLLAILLVSIAGFLFSRHVVLPAMKISEASVMMATLGVGAALTSGAQWLFGASVSYIPSPFADRIYQLGVATISEQSLLLMVAAPSLTAALIVFMRATIAGQRIRAVADAPDLASASGINAPRTQATAAGIGILLAAVAGVLAAPIGVVSVFMGEEVLLKAFAIAALAGIGSVGGALVTGLAIGIFEAIVSGFVTTSYSTAVIYGLLVIALILYPRGLFGGH